MLLALPVLATLYLLNLPLLLVQIHPIYIILSVFTLWAITVYLVRERKNFYITLLPALLMTLVCSTYICIAPEGLSLPQGVAYTLGGACAVVSLVWFIAWYRKTT